MIGIKKQTAFQMSFFITSGLVLLLISSTWSPFKRYTTSLNKTFLKNQPALTLVQADDPILKSPAHPIIQMSPGHQQLIKQMFALLQNKKQGALAANQVGYNKQLFIIKLPDTEGTLKHYTFINPRIVKYSKTKALAPERCLSLPGVVKQVNRSYQITVQALDQNWNSFSLTADGLLARVIQHEMDHLQGILIIDRAN